MTINWIPGSTIYGIPTGNNVRRNKAPVEFEVVKMKRKYVTLKKGNMEDDYYPESGATKNGCNAGYIFFQTKEDYFEYVEIQRKRSFVASAFGSYPRQAVCDRQIELIYDILKDENGDGEE
jgi:hypothetical protein